jgi:DNA polymerase III sliding clamp (beta) subunit (PCNA family)
MRVNRELFLSKLEAVSPGLASRELIEQSSCFVFKGGRIYTFNDEVACSIESPIEAEGAVVAKPLMDLLGKLPEDELEITVGEGKLQVKGNRRRAEVTMEAQVNLPIDSIEVPTSWTELDKEFLEAVNVVKAVASQGKDTNFNLTCVHLHPDHAEACDNFQAARYPVKTGVKTDCLIRAASIKYVPVLGMVEMSEGEAWVHFRNANGLVLSCRRWKEQYENLDAIFQCEGEVAVLPGGLAEAVDKAKIFSSENVESDQVYVRMKAGKLLVRGEGSSGKFEEQKDIKFAGDVSFMIAPALLVEITKRTSDCVVGQGRLKIDTGRWIYVSCLGAVE